MARGYSWLLVLLMISLSVMSLSTASAMRSDSSVFKQGARISVEYYDLTRVSKDGRDALELLKPIHPDYIMRGYWKWGRLELAKHQAYAEKIAEIKREFPDVVVGGFLPMQIIFENELWPDGRAIAASEYDSMVLRDGSGNRIPIVKNYIADPRSQAFQDFLVAWAKKEKEAGVDAIHFDGLGLVAKAALGHGAVNDPHAFDSAFATILTRTRNEAGVLVTANSKQIGEPDAQGFKSVFPNMDYADGKVWAADLDKPFTLHEDYEKARQDMLALYGHELPLNLFLDYGGLPCGGPNVCPLDKFANLSVEDRQSFLSLIANDAQAHGASFIFPVMSGALYPLATLFDSVKYDVYDSIVAIAQGKGTATLTQATETKRPAIPGFPPETLAIGFALAAVLILVTRRRKRQQNLADSRAKHEK